MLVCLPDCRAECRGYKGSGRGKAERAQPFEPPDCAALHAERAVTVISAAGYDVGSVGRMSMVCNVNSHAAYYCILATMPTGLSPIAEGRRIHASCDKVILKLRLSQKITSVTVCYTCFSRQYPPLQLAKALRTCVHVHTELVRYTEPPDGS